MITNEQAWAIAEAEAETVERVSRRRLMARIVFDIFALAAMGGIIAFLVAIPD